MFSNYKVKIDEQNSDRNSDGSLLKKGTSGFLLLRFINQAVFPNFFKVQSSQT